ncbi:MAG: hypothetical protein QG582_1152 [Candidatus Thermoplasmatota archaeon]|nr:hypothetical protein [Candidatus Thermoplasmatota archaeon]
MVFAIDTVLGLLLGVSAFLLVLSLASYRRSGVCSMRLLSEGLFIHVAFTSLIICAGYATDWLAEVDGTLMVVVDAVVLLAVIALARFGGTHGARPS